MLIFPNINAVEVMTEKHLRLHYENGEVKVFDVSPYIKGSWYGKLASSDFFVTVRPVGNTIEWAEGQDIAPHELYENSVSI